MATWSDVTEAELNVLLEQYKLFKQEIWKYIDHYKASLRYSYIILWALAVAVGYLLAHRTETKPSSENWFFWLGGTALFSFTVLYTANSVLEAAYWLNAVAGHMSELESKINKLLRANLMSWESGFSPKFHKLGIIPHPTAMSMFFGSIITIFGAVVIPALLFTYLIHSLNNTQFAHFYFVRTFFYCLWSFNVLALTLMIFQLFAIPYVTRQRDLTLNNSTS